MIQNKIRILSTGCKYNTIISISLVAYLAHSSQDPSPSIPFFGEA
jgi:hypothetical protein